MSHSRALSNIFDNNCWCFFLDQNIVILSIVTRTRWASTSTQGLRSKDHLEHHDQVNVLEHHDQVNVAKVVFQWLTVLGFCGSFLLLLPCTAKPSLSGPACSPTTRSKQATLIIVFCLYRVPSSRQCLQPSSCWSCPRLLACWPSLMGGACFHNIILSFLPSCETFYNGGDKQKKIFTFRNQKMIDLCLNYSIKFQYPSA